MWNKWKCLRVKNFRSKTSAPFYFSPKALFLLKESLLSDTEIFIGRYFWEQLRCCTKEPRFILRLLNFPIWQLWYFNDINLVLLLKIMIIYYVFIYMFDLPCTLSSELYFNIFSRIYSVFFLPFQLCFWYSHH